MRIQYMYEKPLWEEAKRRMCLLSLGYAQTSASVSDIDTYECIGFNPEQMASFVAIEGKNGDGNAKTLSKARYGLHSVDAVLMMI